MLLFWIAMEAFSRQGGHFHVWAIPRFSLGQGTCKVLRGACHIQEQARLSAIQSEVLKGPSDVPGGKALHSTQRIAKALEQLWVHLNRQQHFGRLLAAAEHLGLHRVQLPQRILQARLHSPCQHRLLHVHRASQSSLSI